MLQEAAARAAVREAWDARPACVGLLVVMWVVGGLRRNQGNKCGG